MKLIASVGVLLSLDNETLLLQHRDMNEEIYYPGKIGLFGGEIEDNENHEGAAIREIKEELSINIIKPKLISILSLDLLDQPRFRRRYFYTADVDQTSLNNINLSEGQGIIKIKLKKNINISATKFVPYDLAFILEHFQSKIKHVVHRS
jgi:8-oxo-dGTP pyrophosphatase MutT (NUDIX family)